VDFRSALYLGRNHARRDLPDWLRLTPGKPAALEEPALAQRVALELAGLQGCEDAVIGVSTLHLFWDFFGLVARSPVQIWIDSGVYPVARWGAERAQFLGAAIGEFRHQDAEHLRQRLLRSSGGRRPVVVTDGLCPICGTLAPLGEYSRLMENYGGLLVVDDTQALGILGIRPGPWAPYGEGGGGSLRAAQLEGSEGIVSISSLAKGFGAPMAALSGPAAIVEDFRSGSLTRVHSSPPCVAAVAAAAASLAWNREAGDSARQRLGGLVGRFRRRMLERFGTLPAGGSFPVQNLRHRNAPALHAGLQARGVDALLLQERDTHPGVRLSFIVRADQSPSEIDAAVDTLASLKEVSCPA
jgi:8-amino-7-oxononanoate synthase